MIRTPQRRRLLHPLADWCSAECSAASDDPGGAPARRHPHRQEQRTKDTVLHQLEAILNMSEYPPPSFYEVARRLEINRASAERWYPELCQRISEQYQRYRRQGATERMATMIDHVRTTIYTLHSQGEYPSLYRVAAVLSTPEYFLNPQVVAIWRATLKELGLNDE
jgi:hypothetical protein